LLRFLVEVYHRGRHQVLGLVQVRGRVLHLWQVEAVLVLVRVGLEAQVLVLAFLITFFFLPKKWNVSIIFSYVL
jgi:hypothetical protein